MSETFLVTTSLSSLFSLSQITPIPLKTSRRDTPLPVPPNASDPPAEHASHSCLLHLPSTGPILLRVIHDGFILELIAFNSQVAPIRFLFPSPILPSPGIFVWQESELHVIAATRTGSIYRLVLPIGLYGRLWSEPSGADWCREYLIKTGGGSIEGLVQVQGPHCIAIGMANGALLRIETEYLGHQSRDDKWTEFLFQHGSFLSSLTAFLPSLHSGPSGGSDIVAMTSHPQPTDISYTWTLSRDRTLRLWTAKAGCVAEKTLSSTFTSSGGTPVPGHAIKSQLLEAEHQTLLRTFSTNSTEEGLYLLAFIPTPSSATSGGFFQLFETADDQLYEMGKIACSNSSAHCHLRDFVIDGDNLYILWDRQGQSTVEKTLLNPEELAGLTDANWRSASHAPEPDLTPAYLEELLLSPGSLADNFLEAIMRPGMFSPLTLRTAIEQYRNACLSLPGHSPSQLTTAYATVGENIAAIVGCTVTLLRDTHTGALQHANYWNALKRDWEGFIARCREIERSARWPLALGAGGPGRDVFVIERERVSSVVEEDLALRLRRLLDESAQLDPGYTLLDIVWMLRTKLGPEAMLSLEHRLFDICHQEIGFSLADIVQDQVDQAKFIDDLDDGMQSWILGRLDSIPHLDREIRTILDVIGGLDKAVKQEEDEVADEVALRTPPPRSEFFKALTAAYVTATVNARYELCLTLMVILFFLSLELPEWSPALLAEMFAVFRGIAMLRCAVRRSTGDSTGTKSADDPTSTDDVIARMSSMQVSQNRTQFTSDFSLIHRLLAISGATLNLAAAAHHYLDNSGMLRSTTPADVTNYEIRFCNGLRELGYYEVAREMLAWLPRTPSATYVCGRLWLDIGRADDAAFLMEKLAARAGPESGLWGEDKEALDEILPVGTNASEYTFYCHAAELFRYRSIRHEVTFSQLALTVSLQGTDVRHLWTSVITGNIALGLYEDAYAAIIATPYDDLKRECVGQLVYRMCEQGSVEKLVSFNFARFADEVEDALAFKARNVDPRARPFYSRILYSWFVFRGDYRNAALTMYQRARSLQDLMNDPSTLISLAEEQLEAYMVAINALCLLDRKSAWIAIPISHTAGQQSYKRRKLSKHIPEARYTVGTRDMEAVDLSDIQYEYALLSAQIDLVRRDSSLLSAGDFSLPPTSVISRLVQSNRFNIALATARSLNVDMTDLFIEVTSQCLRLSHNMDTVLRQDTSDWLLTDNVSSWSGTPADRGWRYLRQCLERHDSSETDFKYAKVTFETILSFDRTSSPPPWLTQSLEEHHHEYLIRTSLRYEMFESALIYSLSLVRKTDNHLTRDPSKFASTTWLPYTLIDQVLVATGQGYVSPNTKTLRQELQNEIAGHLKRVQRLSQASR